MKYTVCHFARSAGRPAFTTPVIRATRLLTSPLFLSYITMSTIQTLSYLNHLRVMIFRLYCIIYERSWRNLTKRVLVVKRIVNGWKRDRIKKTMNVSLHVLAEQHNPDSNFVLIAENDCVFLLLWITDSFHSRINLKKSQNTFVL